MSKIRSKNTKAELVVFSELRKNKIYFQKHYKKAPGSPDIAFPKNKKAVFIDGDFWHGRNFLKDQKRLPNDYWRNKIKSNVLRDKKNFVELRKKGWKVLRLWEKDIIKNNKRAVAKIKKLIEK